MQALSTGISFDAALQAVWNDDTNLLFTSIISFWFGSRQFAKLRKKRKMKNNFEECMARLLEARRGLHLGTAKIQGEGEKLIMELRVQSMSKYVRSDKLWMAR